MSLSLYTIRVWGNNDHFSVKTKKVFRRMMTRQMPKIPGLPSYTEIDFAPETSTYLLRESLQGLREMTEKEVQAVNQWLEALDRDASNLVFGESQPEDPMGNI